MTKCESRTKDPFGNNFVILILDFTFPQGRPDCFGTARVSAELTLGPPLARPSQRGGWNLETVSESFLKPAVGVV